LANKRIHMLDNSVFLGVQQPRRHLKEADCYMHAHSMRTWEATTTSHAFKSKWTQVQVQKIFVYFATVYFAYFLGVVNSGPHN